MIKKIIKFFLIPILIGLVVKYFPNTDQQNNAESNKSVTTIIENHITIERNNVSSNLNKPNSYSKEHSTDKVSHTSFKQAKNTKKEFPSSIPESALSCFKTIDDPLDCPL